MKRTTIITLIIEEDSFPTRVEPRDVIDTTAEELPRARTILPPPLPPGMSRLARWVGAVWP